MYPEQYTAFTAKQNAAYAGDPAGDYVLAEDINGVQTAVSALEQAVGIYHPAGRNLFERIQHLEKANTARVPEVAFLTDSGYTNSLTTSVETLAAYALVSLGTTDAHTAELVAALTAKGIKVLGVVDGTQTPEGIQAAVAVWQTFGVSGIHLKNFGSELQPTRTFENELLDGLAAAGQLVLLESALWTKLFGNAPLAGYNDTPDEATALHLSENSILAITPFAYGSDGQSVRAYFGSEVSAKLTPFLAARQATGAPLLGLANPYDQTSHDYSQAYALLYSLDYLLLGSPAGRPAAQTPLVFNWPIRLSNWYTTAPVVFAEATVVSRYTPQGKISVFLDGHIAVEGHGLDASFLTWEDNSLSGSVLANNSLDAAKLKNYDASRILDALNAALAQLDAKVTLTTETGLRIADGTNKTLFGADPEAGVLLLDGSAKVIGANDEVWTLEQAFGQNGWSLVYRAEVGSSNGTVFKKGATNTTLAVMVKQGLEDKTAVLPASQFRWTRSSSEPESDAVWNASNGSDTKMLNITPADMNGTCSFVCAVTIPD